jgi:hypothetical protein
VGLPPFSLAELINIAAGPLAQEVFSFLKHKATRDRGVFDRVAQATVVNARRGGVRVDQAALRGLLAQDRLRTALVSHDFAELDAMLGSVVQPPAGGAAEQARAVLVAVLLLAINQELPADRQLDLAAHRNVIHKLDKLQAEISRLSEEIGGPVRSVGYRDSYDAVIEAFERHHLPGLKERETELAGLARQIAAGPGYLAVEAPMYAGKTALFAALRRRLVEDGCAVVMFYIRRGSDDSRAEFLPKVITQLLRLLESLDPRFAGEGVATTPEARDTQFADLWQQTTRVVDRPVVLLVDALDEQRNPQQAGGSLISQLLPADLGVQGRLVVSSRLNPDFATVVPPEHPLADLADERRVRLAPSPHATAQREKIRRELDHQLATGDPNAEHLTGMYAIATAPLSDHDLADLLDLTPGQVARLREPIASSLLCFPDPDGPDRFDLGHAAQRQHVRVHLGERGTQQLIDRVVAWADRYAEQGWPDETPAFLRDHLHTFLLNTSRPDRTQRLLGLVTNARRDLYQRIRHYLDGFLTTIDATAQALSDQSPSPGQIADYLWLLLHRIEATESVIAIPTSVLRALACTGFATQALGIASTLPTPDNRAHVLVDIAVACAQAGDFANARKTGEQAREAAAEIDDPFQRDLALCRVAVALAQARQPEQARQATATITHLGARASALSEVAVALAQVGQLEQARQAAEQARQAATDHPWERARIFSKVAVAFAQVGQLEQARQAAEQARQAATDHPWERARIFNKVAVEFAQGQWVRDLWKVAVAFAQIGQPKQARQAAEQARQAAANNTDLSWRTFELSETAVVFAQIGQPKQARQAAEQARQAAEQAQQGTAAIQGAQRVGHAAANLAQAGQPEQARQTATIITDPRERARALGRVAVALAQVGEPVHARQAAEQTRQIAAAIHDPWEQAQALSEAAVALAHAGEPSQARQAADLARQAATTITDPWKRAQDIEGAVAVALAHARQSEQAQQAAAAIANPGWRAKALAEVAIALTQAGQPDQARQAATAVSDPELRARALGEVAVALAQARQPEQARQTAEQARQAATNIADRKWRIMALEEVAVALARAGQLEQAAAIITSPGRRAKMLGEAVVAFAQAGQTQQAWQAAELVQQAAEQARQNAATIDDSRWGNDRWRAETLREAAVALAQVGQPEQARQTAAIITDPRGRARALGRVAVALAQVGQPEQARQTAEEARQAATKITDPWWRAHELVAIAVACAESGDAPNARQAAEHARQVTTTVTHPELRAEALGEVAVALAHAGQLEQARQTAEQTRQIATILTDRWGRILRLKDAAVALAHAGQFEQARQTAATIGQPEQARQTAATITDREWRAKALGEVAVALGHAGQPEQARQAAQQARKAASDVDSLGGRARALSKATAALVSAGCVEYLAAMVHVLQYALRIEEIKTQEDLFLESYLAALALFPDDLKLLTARFLISRPAVQQQG